MKRQLALQNEALGMEAGYTAKISEVYENFRSKYRQSNEDDRAAYHIQTACLVLAAYRVLTEQVKLDAQKSVEIINKQCMGDSDSWGEKIIQNALMMISRLLQYRVELYDMLCQTSERMKNLDMGKLFLAETTTSEHEHVTTVRACFYHNFFTENNAAHLTSAIFCPAEGKLYEKATGYKLSDLGSICLFMPSCFLKTLQARVKELEEGDCTKGEGWRGEERRGGDLDPLASHQSMDASLLYNLHSSQVACTQCLQDIRRKEQHEREPPSRVVHKRASAAGADYEEEMKCFSHVRGDGGQVERMERNGRNRSRPCAASQYKESSQPNHMRMSVVSAMASSPSWHSHREPAQVLLLGGSDGGDVKAVAAVRGGERGSQGEGVCSDPPPEVLAVASCRRFVLEDEVLLHAGERVLLSDLLDPLVQVLPPPPLRPRVVLLDDAERP
eukprot:762587-Hanusia_phi.AAC.3